MNLRTRRARTAGAVAAVVAAATTVGLALTAGNASADEPGRCTQNVNVREEPDPTSRIVALCESGTPVALGEERAGFVQLDDLGGWASRDFVSGTARAADAPVDDSVDDSAAPARPANPTATPTPARPDDRAAVNPPVAPPRLPLLGGLFG